MESEKREVSVSIVTAVYNGEKYLSQTLDSVLRQTFDDFELVVIDDASTDGTADILRKYAERDGRIKVYRNEQNLRLARSLNRGVSLAEGKYIARLDADDICMPNRLEKQYDFMENNPDIGVSFCKFFALRDGELMPCGLGRRRDPESVKAMLPFFCPVLHPGVIARSDVMKKYSYDGSRTCTEDIDLWTRMTLDGVKIACDGEYLMQYRLHGGSITSTSRERQEREVLEIESNFYEKTLFRMDEKEKEFYIKGVYFREKCCLSALYSFYKKIMLSNKRRGFFVKKNIIYSIIEVLAEYNGRERFGLSEKLSMLRFGGIHFVSEYVKRKKAARVDASVAESEAVKAGFVKIREENGVPYFALSETEVENG